MKTKSNRNFKTWKPHFHYYVDKHYGGKNAWRNCKRAHHYFLHHRRELFKIWEVLKWLI